MTETDGYDAYCLYMAIRLHFSSDTYNYFLYQGKTQVTKTAFTNRKDKFVFYRIARKYNISDLRDLYVSNFIDKEKWINELNGVEGEECYKKWKKINQALTHHFTNDIIYLLEKYDTPKLTDCSNGYPKLLEELMWNKITLETVCILNDIMNFLPMWNNKIDDEYIWPIWKKKIEKYTPFIVYDKTKFKNLIKEKMKAYEQA